MARKPKAKQKRRPSKAVREAFAYLRDAGIMTSLPRPYPSPKKPT